MRMSLSDRANFGDFSVACGLGCFLHSVSMHEMYKYYQASLSTTSLGTKEKFTNIYLLPAVVVCNKQQNVLLGNIWIVLFSPFYFIYSLMVSCHQLEYDIMKQLCIIFVNLLFSRLKSDMNMTNVQNVYNMNIFSVSEKPQFSHVKHFVPI